MCEALGLIPRTGGREGERERERERGEAFTKQLKVIFQPLPNFLEQKESVKSDTFIEARSYILSHLSLDTAPLTRLPLMSLPL
jgi:hypothetical protein